MGSRKIQEVLVNLRWVQGCFIKFQKFFRVFMGLHRALQKVTRRLRGRSRGKLYGTPESFKKFCEDFDGFQELFKNLLGDQGVNK